MTKAVKIALAALCAGALLAGVGAGVAFGEYSSLDYERYELPIAGERKTVTETFDIPQDGKVMVTSPWKYSLTIVEDEGVAAGTIVVTASAAGLADEVVIDPHIDTVPANDPNARSSHSTGEPGSSPDAEADGSGREEGPAAAQEWIERLCITAYPINDDGGFSQFMQFKDVYLEGLKRGVVYDIPSVYDDFVLEIRINPVDRARISSY